MQKRAAASSQFFQHGSEPELVAKTVLTAINTPNPNLFSRQKMLKSG
jgi:hypothetical protein